MPSRIAERLGRVRLALQDAGLDAFLVTDLTNVHYLTGFVGTAGAVLVAPSTCRLVVDFRYVTAAKDVLAGVPDVEVEVVERSYDETIVGLVQRDRLLRTGIEAASMPVKRFNELSAATDAADFTDRRTATDPADFTDRRTATDAADFTDRRSATDPADFADRRTATDPADFTDRRSATDPADFTDRRSATDPADFADRRTATDPADFTDRRSATDAADFTDRRSATDAADFTDRRTATDAADFTDRRSATDAADFTDRRTATDPADFTDRRSATDAADFTDRRTATDPADFTDRLRTPGAAAPAGGLNPVLVPTERVVEALRLIKDADEIAALREGGRRLSRIACRVHELVRPGRREQDIAWDIDVALRDAGFSRPAFDTIVASGPNSALPHARPTARALEAGDAVVLDFGGVYNGYCVDLTRTVQLGAPSAALRHLYEAVAAAQAAAIQAVRPGVRASAIDAAARETLASRGLGKAFGHGTGHGLGLEVHEEPRISHAVPGLRDEAIAPGMVFTIEPGAYVPGLGGVRIEDDVLVTEDGCEALTSAPVLIEVRA